MTGKQFRQLLQELADKPTTNIQPSIFTGAEGEDILSWLNKFELIAANSNWNDEKQGRSVPMYLDKSELIYYNSLPEQTKANQQLVKQTLRIQYHSPINQCQLRSELYVLALTGTLSQYTGHREIISQRLNINQETKLHHFINRLKPHLKQALLLRQPPDYNTAVCYAKVKDSTSANNYDRLLEQIKQLTHSNTRQEPPVNNANYPDPVNITQENAKLKTRIKQLEPKTNTSNTALFPSYNRNLRKVDGQPISNRCKKVGHAERVCRQN